MFDTLPKDWGRVPLEDCLDALIDYRGKSPNKVSFGIPLITAKVVKGGRVDTTSMEYINPGEYDVWMRRGMPRRGDVLLTSEAPLGEVAQITDERVALAQRLFTLRGAVGRLDNTFLKFFLQSDFAQGQLQARATGTTVLGIRQSELRRIIIALPPIAEQQGVAHILGSIDDKIEVNRRTSETLEAMARALFKSWFVDFDPVRAKSEGRKPAGMDAETAKLFPNAFESSKVEEAPKQWTRAALGDWVTALSGGTPSKSDSTLWGGEIPWISPKAMKSIHADDSDEHVTPNAIGNGTRLAPARSTLVMVRGMGLHEEVRVSQVRRDVTFNQDVKALVPRGIEASLLLFALLDAQEELLGKVESSGHGTGRLASEILLAHPVTMPPVAVQKVLATTFDALNDRIASARSESRTLAELRDTLLPKLMSGELRLKDAEKLASNAL